MAWLANWIHRKSITLSRASGLVTNYQMKLLVGQNSRPLTAPNAASYKVSTNGYFAENIVFDSVTNKYWWIFADTTGTPTGIRLASSDTIDGTYTVEAGYVIYDASHSLQAPHLAKFGSYWYIYYERRDGSTGVIPGDIWVQKSTTVNSGYSDSGISNPILSRGGAGDWDGRRIGEPFVFLEGSTYYMFFMGEDLVNNYEITGYATSPDPVTGWTKYGSNPVISGNTGAWDAGGDRAADPFVFKKDGVFYIGVTACSSGKGSWQSGFYTTTNFVTFKPYPSNPVLKHGSGGTWDDDCDFRGAVMVINGVYYYTYTGYDGSTGYKLGMTILDIGSAGIYLEGKGKTDFSDLRFTKSDGTTLLDYWIESISGVNPDQIASVWIEFDSIGTGSTNFYAYYGNTGASVVSSGINTFLFFDDFNSALDTSKWNDRVGTTPPATSGGNLVLTGGATPPGVRSSGNSWLYNLRFRGKLYSNNGQSGLALALSNSTMAVDVSADDSVGIKYRGATANQFNSYCSDEGIGTNVNFGSSDTNPHLFEGRWISGNFDTYVDDLLINSKITNVPNESLSPRLQLSNAAAIGYIDWFFVAQYVSVEPTWDLFGIEESPQSTKTINMDVLLKFTETRSTNLDTLLRSRDTKTANIDTLIRFLGDQKTVNADVLIRSLNNQRTINLDGLIRLTDYRLVNMDTIIGSSGIRSINLDILIKFLNAQKTINIDTLIGYLGITKTENIDTLLRLSDFKSIGIDTIIDELIPTVISPNSISLSPNSALGSAIVSDDGGDPVLDRGCVISTSPDPTISDTKFSTTGTLGIFNVFMTGLVPGITYHMRGFATNGVGTGYSIDITFITRNINSGGNNRMPNNVRNLNRSDYARVWFIEDRAGPANAPQYEGLWKAGSLAWPQGDVKLTRIPDPDKYGEFIVVDKIPGEQGTPSLSITARSTFDRSDLLRVMKKGCDSDIQIHMGKCSDPQSFNEGWEKIIVLDAARITNWQMSTIGALEPSERTVENEEVPFSGEDLYEIMPIVLQEKAGAEVNREIIAIVICDRVECGSCGISSDGCDKIFALAVTVGGSPGLLGEIIFSDDGGNTWNDTTITTLSAAENGSDEACVGLNLIVISKDSCSIHYAALTDILNGTETWAEVTTGFVALKCPNAIFSVDARHTWIVGNAGYIYFTSDPTSGVDVQNAGAATIQNLTAIHGFDALNLVAVGASNAIVVTRNGGDSWTAVTGPVPAVAINAIWMKGVDEWFIGTAGGELWYTLDGGLTWTKKSFPGSGTGAVMDIKFSNETVGWMGYHTATPAGKILRTIDGGYSWYVTPEGNTSIPANDRITALAPCEHDINLIYGGGLADTGTDGIIVKGS